MKKTQIINFLNNNPICNLATVDSSNKPCVRGMLMYRADDKGIVFHTGNKKDLYKQLQNNPNVEVAFYSPSTNIQIRVCGKVEFINDQKLKEEIVAARAFLKPWIEKQGYDMLVVFRIINCQATVWMLEKNFAPKEYITI